MTTIAYSRAAGQVAADTQCTNGTRKMRTHKVHRLKDGSLFAGAGNLVHITKVHRWAMAGFAEDERPDFGDEDGEFEALIVLPDGTARVLDEGMEMLPFTDDFIAMGSGSSYALAAMYCGKSPAEAVEVAAVYDCATSGPVEVFSVKGKAKCHAKKRTTRRKPSC